MRAMVRMTVAAALMLAGCARLPIGHHAPPRGGETITYDLEATSFCLRCASYSITLGPDGQGIFEGRRGAAAPGEHRFSATKGQVRAFNKALAPYRPEGELRLDNDRLCGPLMTDQDTVDVRWTASDGGSSQLVFYGGCDVDKNRKMADALFSAPKLLPIADLIGKGGS